MASGFLVYWFGRLLFGFLGLSVGSLGRFFLRDFMGRLGTVFGGLLFFLGSSQRREMRVLEGSSSNGCLAAILGVFEGSVGDVGPATGASPPRSLQ